MPLQIFCTISFSSEEAPEDAAGTEKEEDEADEFLYGQEEDEEDEEDAGATTDFVAFASSCTLHGLSHIFVEGSLGARQALWALAFLLSLSVFLYQVADRIAYYLEYHHVTLLSEEDSPEMTFPAVTFCNINRVRLSQLSHEDLLYLAPLVDYEPGMELGFTPAQPGPWEEDEPLNLLGFFNRTCHQLEDMLLSCSYRGQRCGPGDFAPVSSPRVARHGEQLRSCSVSDQARQVMLPLQLAQGQADISAPSAKLGTAQAVELLWWDTECIPGAALVEEVPGTSILVPSGFVGTTWCEPTALTCLLPRLAAAPWFWGHAGCRRQELEQVRRDGGSRIPSSPVLCRDGGGLGGGTGAGIRLSATTLGSHSCRGLSGAVICSVSSESVPVGTPPPLPGPAWDGWPLGLGTLSWLRAVAAHRGASASALCPLLQVFTRYGKCYTFNAGQDGKPRLITMKGGTGNGLEIMLDIQQDEYLPVWGETGNPLPQRAHSATSSSWGAAQPLLTSPAPSHLSRPQIHIPEAPFSSLLPFLITSALFSPFSSLSLLFAMATPHRLDTQPSLVYK